MKSTAYKLLLSVFITFAQVIAPSLTGRAGGESLSAQDAFYIYRNDGDFNGFFYDEVKRMGYSKFDLDSVEHDVYVVQEVETVDSLYRIPLAAIDSIGFQQPEIKFNPKLKLLGKCGLLPYVEGGRDGYAVFKDVPDNLKPQIGDVLVGLPTDGNGEDNNYVGGSFSCVVESIEADKWDPRRIICRGHGVENISDVFEQYITLEDLGYDKNGNLVRRRVAGREPKYASGKTDFYNLIDLKGTIQREWEPDDNSSISLSADVGVVFRVRLAYDIGWWKFFIKMNRELLVDIEPALSMSVSRSFEVALGNTIAGYGIPLRIWFPTECPIFQLEPYPDWFVRGEGKLEAKLKFPKMHLGFGEDVIFDSSRLFPIDYGLRWVPEQNSNSNLIDIGSTNVSLSGFVQTGLKFHVSIGTASWFKKAFNCTLGADIYVGPKLDSSLEFSTDWLNNEGINLYNKLAGGSINATWLSVDLNVGTTASILGGTEVNKTFYSTNFPFFRDTLRFIPRFNLPTSTVNGNTATVIFHSMQDRTLGYTTIGAVLEESGASYGDMTYTKDQKDYSFTIPTDGLKAGPHTVNRVVTWAGYGPFVADNYSAIIVPIKSDVPTDKIVFENIGQEKRIRFTTNAPEVRVFDFDALHIEARIDTINEAKGVYELVLKNNYISPFYSDFKHTEEFGPYIVMGAPNQELIVQRFDVYQAGHPSEVNATATIDASFGHNGSYYGLRDEYPNFGNQMTFPLILSSVSSNKIHASGSVNDGGLTANLEFDVEWIWEDEQCLRGHYVFSNGSASSTIGSTATFNCTFESNPEVVGGFIMTTASGSHENKNEYATMQAGDYHAFKFGWTWSPK